MIKRKINHLEPKYLTPLLKKGSPSTRVRCYLYTQANDGSLGMLCNAVWYDPIKSLWEVEGSLKPIIFYIEEELHDNVIEKAYADQASAPENLDEPTANSKKFDRALLLSFAIALLGVSVNLLAQYFDGGIFYISISIILILAGAIGGFSTVMHHEPDK